MTREEAITNLNMIRVAFGVPVTKEQRELVDDTFEMAIQALSQEPCDDAISRDMALKKMADYVASGYADSVEDFENRYIGTYEDEYSYIDELIENGVINPSELVEKEGTWVIDHDALWRYYVNSGDIHGERTDYGLAVWYRG